MESEGGRKGTGPAGPKARGTGEGSAVKGTSGEGRAAGGSSGGEKALEGSREDDEETRPPGPSVILAALDELVSRLVRVADWGAGLVSARSLVNRIARPIFSWSQRASIFALHSGLACCAMEMGVAGMPRLDSERLGVAWFSSPRRCDLFIVNGWITKKTRPVLRTLYEQMPEPKWVIAMGECAISGGPWHDSYNVVFGADEVVPVDIYIPGCPPRPEALLDALVKLQKKIEREGTTSGLRLG